MCGIAGIFDPQGRHDPAARRAIAAAMAARLRHRGPDCGGLWADGEAGIALGFRRLSIIDLSPAGHQPMVSGCGRLVVMCNGEIYNHRALRDELSAVGIASWRGHSDTEVMLAAIAQWGFVGALRRAEGMFAIALWDRAARRLWLARDRFGEKPLYYGMLDGALVFASEIKALAVHPAWTGELDRGALGLFLAHDYVPAPWSAYRGIRKLPAGHFLATEADGALERCIPYWSAEEAAAESASTPFGGTAGEAADALQSIVDYAVATRLESDVPIGAFLSGGIDSTTVIAAMQRARPGGVRSFAIGFPDVAHDESPHAAAVAAHLGTSHTTLVASDADCRAIVPALPETYDEPFADPSQIPTILLCRLTRQHVTVSLSGDGGDELFGGYERYRRTGEIWTRTARMPALWRGGVSSLARGVCNQAATPGRLRKLARPWTHRTPESLYRDHVTRWRASELAGEAADWPRTRFDAPLLDALPSLEQRLMFLDAMTYLPDDLLVKIDRASMSCGLETRAPLLDSKLARFAWSLPPHLALGSGAKALLREALYRQVPRKLVDRPKHGFTPPIERWLRDGLRDWADDLLAGHRLRRHGFVDAALVASRWSEHRRGRRNWASPLWNVLTLEAWLDREEQRAASPLPAAAAVA